VVVTGSQTWQSKSKIKESLFQMKKSKNIRVISGGCTPGADPIIRECCIELKIDYAEIPPADHNWNQFCIGDRWLYGKERSGKNMFIRNLKLEKIGEILILFKSASDKSKYITDLEKKFSKAGKNVIKLMEDS